jgi:hypothetical protein
MSRRRSYSRTLRVHPPRELILMHLFVCLRVPGFRSMWPRAPSCHVPAPHILPHRRVRRRDVTKDSTQMIVADDDEVINGQSLRSIGAVEPRAGASVFDKRPDRGAT